MVYEVRSANQKVEDDSGEVTSKCLLHVEQRRQATENQVDKRASISIQTKIHAFGDIIVLNGSSRHSAELQHSNESQITQPEIAGRQLQRITSTSSNYIKYFE